MFTACVCYSPAPQVSWSRVGGSLPVSRIRRDQDGTLFEISRLEAGDEGEYKCQGSNMQGSQEHTMKIDIQCMFELRLFLVCHH